MILHRQGTQPRLMDSSEHSSLSINLNLRKRNSIYLVIYIHIYILFLFLNIITLPVRGPERRNKTLDACARPITHASGLESRTKSGPC